MLISVIKLVVICITLLVWAVIGFLFWIPMLARAIALLSVSTLYATMNRLDESYLDRAKSHLADAVTFGATDSD